MTTKSQTPLPKVESPLVQSIANEDPNHLRAYNLCLQHERELAEFENKLRHVRIVGFLLLHAPNQDIRSEVTKFILSHKDIHGLSDVGAFFERNLILPFMKFRGRTPTPGSEHSSRSSFEDAKNELKVDITEAPKNHRDAKYRALIRDNWRCVVTGALDYRAPEDTDGFDPTEPVAGTKCAYIIPQSAFFKDNCELEHSASILAVLKRFRHDITEFNGPKVHSLINVMSMEYNIYDFFDRLALYFEATSEKNRYEVKLCRQKPVGNVRQFVTFSTPDPENLPVPSSELLALHATCCKVAHLSGAFEYIDQICLDTDTMGILSSDDTSCDILHYVLSSLSGTVS